MTALVSCHPPGAVLLMLHLLQLLLQLRLPLPPPLPLPLPLQPQGQLLLHSHLRPTMTAACCSTNTGRGECFAKHVAKEQPQYGMRRKIAKREAEPTRQSPRRQRTGSADAADGGSAPRQPNI